MTSRLRALGMVALGYLLLGCSAEPEKRAEVRRVAQPVAVVEHLERELLLPSGVSLENIVLSSRDSLRLADGVVVSAPAPSAAAVVHVGSTRAEMGADAVLGGPTARVHIVSAGNVWLRESALVSGNLSTGGALETQNGTVVQGVVTQGQAIPLRAPLKLRVAFTLSDADRRLEPDQVQEIFPTVACG